MRIFPINRNPINIIGTDIYYIPVPKIACTSMKASIYKYNHPIFYKLYNIFDPIYKFNPHRVYGSARFSRHNFDLVAGRFFCFVRDPIERFISAYDDIVLIRKKLSTVSRISPEKKLSDNPSIDQFLSRFDDYMEHGPYVRHHFSPMVTYLGDDPSFYYKIFLLNDFGSALKFISENGVDLEPVHTNKSMNKYNKSILNVDQRKIVKQIYKKDYEFIRACDL